tara:strand:+ start:62316 stop:62540 length:225 start_codon:yes stop_codon:yes gene_type:complete
MKLAEAIELMQQAEDYHRVTITREKNPPTWDNAHTVTLSVEPTRDGATWSFFDRMNAERFISQYTTHLTEKGTK